MQMFIGNIISGCFYDNVNSKNTKIIRDLKQLLMILTNLVLGLFLKIAHSIITIKGQNNVNFVYYVFSDA